MKRIPRRSDRFLDVVIRKRANALLPWPSLQFVCPDSFATPTQANQSFLGARRGLANEWVQTNGRHGSPSGRSRLRGRLGGVDLPEGPS